MNNRPLIRFSVMFLSAQTHYNSIQRRSPSLHGETLRASPAMEKSHMNEFHFESDPFNISDSEIAVLLNRAYVEGGFTTPERAANTFVPSAVRKRGETIFLRTSEGALAGMVIVVRPDAPARRMAEPDEAEIHLLAVDPQYQGNGLGRSLMTKALELIKDMGFHKTVLWTQPTMIPAHRLYESLGFTRAAARDPVFDGVYFLAYVKNGP